MSSGWSSTPYGHRFRPVSDEFLREHNEERESANQWAREKHPDYDEVPFPRMATREDFPCVLCNEGRELHAEPVPPDVAMGEAEAQGQIQRLEGF